MDGTLAMMLMFAAFLWFLVYIMQKNDHKSESKESKPRDRNKDYENGYSDGFDDGRLAGYKQGLKDVADRSVNTVTKAIKIRQERM